MAQGNGPLFSLEATGSIGNALTYGKRLGRNIIKRKNVTVKTRTLAQIISRAVVAYATPVWNSLSESEKNAWNVAAEPLQISGYNLFISTSRKNQMEDRGVQSIYSGGSGHTNDPYGSNSITNVNGTLQLHLELAGGPFSDQTYAMTIQPFSVTPVTRVADTAAFKLPNAQEQATAEMDIYLTHVPVGSYSVGCYSAGPNGEVGNVTDVGSVTVS